MGSIIFGFIFIIFGAFMTIKSEGFFQTFGSVPFAEKYLGAEGGSRLFYKLLGILLIILGFLLITGLFGSLFMGIFGSIFRGMAPQG